jgi:hypothetical protein
MVLTASPPHHKLKLQRLGKYLHLPRPGLAQVLIKRHGHISYKDAAERRDLYAVAVEPYKPVALKLGETRKLQREVSVEIDAVLALDLRFE